DLDIRTDAVVLHIGPLLVRQIDSRPRSAHRGSVDERVAVRSDDGAEGSRADHLDRINQETPAVAVELTDAAAPFLPKSSSKATKFDRHAGVGETSGGLYLFPTLVDMSKAGPNRLQLPEHLRSMFPDVIARDPTTTSV